MGGRERATLKYQVKISSQMVHLSQKPCEIITILLFKIVPLYTLLACWRAS